MGSVEKLEDGLRSVSGLGRLFGRDRGTIKRHIDAAKLQPAGSDRGHNVYRVEDVAAILFGSNIGDIADPETLPPKERLDWYKGSQARRVDALEAGEVVKAEEARDAMATLIKATMLALDTLTEVVEREAKLTPDQAGAVSRIIDRERRTLHAALMAARDAQ